MPKPAASFWPTMASMREEGGRQVGCSLSWPNTLKPADVRAINSLPFGAARYAMYAKEKSTGGDGGLLRALQAAHEDGAVGQVHELQLRGVASRTLPREQVVGVEIV